MTIILPNFVPIAIEKYPKISNFIAEVSKPGQPRRTQDPHIIGNPFSQEFVGSNPTLCTISIKIETIELFLKLCSDRLDFSNWMLWNFFVYVCYVLILKCKITSKTFPIDFRHVVYTLYYLISILHDWFNFFQFMINGIKIMKFLDNLRSFQSIFTTKWQSKGLETK